jgi:hypothetical protein
MLEETTQMALLEESSSDPVNSTHWDHRPFGYPLASEVAAALQGGHTLTRSGQSTSCGVCLGRDEHGIFLGYDGLGGMTRHPGLSKHWHDLAGFQQWLSEQSDWTMSGHCREVAYEGARFKGKYRITRQRLEQFVRGGDSDDAPRLTEKRAQPQPQPQPQRQRQRQREPLTAVPVASDNGERFTLLPVTAWQPGHTGGGVRSECELGLESESEMAYPYVAQARVDRRLARMKSAIAHFMIDFGLSKL